jgi:hypothetical protein
VSDVVAGATAAARIRPVSDVVAGGDARSGAGAAAGRGGGARGGGGARNGGSGAGCARRAVA